MSIIKDEFDQLNSVIQTYADILDKSMKIFDELDFEKIVLWYSEFKKDEKQNKINGHNFNVFDLLQEEFGFTLQETMHSKLLKYLLNPKASHGQDKIFLNEFLRMLEIEVPDKGQWFISSEEGKIDLLIKRNEPHSIIIVENKSNWAIDQPNQLYRYWYNTIYQAVKEESLGFYNANKSRYQIIYLSPNGYKNYLEQSITRPNEKIYNNFPDIIPMDIKEITFDKFIIDWLENSKNILNKENHRIREFLTQYQLLCEKL